MKITSKIRATAKSIFSFRSVRPIGIGGPIQKPLVFVQILPDSVVDVVSKPVKDVSDACRAINDTCGFETLNDAVLDAQYIGFCLLGHVKPENLLFVFSETVQSLQHGLGVFLHRHSVPYPAEDCYAPIYKEQDSRTNKCDADPLAITLCKLKTADGLQRIFGGEKKNGGNGGDRYEITWSELKNLQRKLENVADTHSGISTGSNTNQQNTARGN